MKKSTVSGPSKIEAEAIPQSRLRRDSSLCTREPWGDAAQGGKEIGMENGKPGWDDWSQAQRNTMTRATYRFALRAMGDPELWARVQERKEQLYREGKLPRPEAQAAQA